MPYLNNTPVLEEVNGIDIDWEDYIHNLEAEGLFANEELGESEDEEEQRTEEEQLPSRREELAIDLSSVWNGEVQGIREHPCERRFEACLCDCITGKTCRWRDAFTYNYILGRQVENQESKLLGLCMFETWRLQSDKISEEGIRIRLQGRQGTLDPWEYPEGIFDIWDVEIRGCCKDDNVWLYRGIGDYFDARLWITKLNEINKLQVIRYECSKYTILETSQFADKVQWNGHEYWTYSRLVEYQFNWESSFQTETDVDTWTREYVKDDAPFEVKRVFAHLPSASGRGLLRYI